MKTRLVALEVPPHDEGLRLDRFLALSLDEVGRRQVALWCDEGRVRIDGKRAKKSAVLACGSIVTVELAASEQLRAEPELALEVRVERPELVIVNKPAGMPTAPLRHDELGSLCGALLARYPEMTGVGYRAREPGIVHRLDTQTSGLVLAARSAESFAHLHAALERGQLHKRYLAVVAARGVPPQGEIASALAPDPAHRERVRVLDSTEKGSYARHKLTRFRLQRANADWALLEVEVGSAFRHQIRAHLASIGHPIAGDAVYGGPPASGLGARHALHASQISWQGDAQLAAFSVSEALPEALARLVA